MDMKRFLAAIIVVASVLGVFRTSSMFVMAMTDHGMDCENGACAASPTPMAPAQDCLDHCLRAAVPSAAAPSPVVLAFVLLLSVGFAIGRAWTTDARDTGAAPSIGPSLHRTALAGVVMLN